MKQQQQQQNIQNSSKVVLSLASLRIIEDIFADLNKDDGFPIHIDTKVFPPTPFHLRWRIQR